MGVAHNLGFPRIGARRELKTALEAYWRGELDARALADTGRELRARHWQLQAQAGIELLPVGDFAWYDHVLETSALLGVVPARFGAIGEHVDLDTYFRMARGRARQDDAGATHACEMTKWFDTNYHYLVPELVADQHFRIASAQLFEQVAEAQHAGHRVKPVLLGPLSYLWLAKTKGADFDKLDLLERLLPVYGAILARLHAQGVEWVQIYEPILVLDLPPAWQTAFEVAYHQLQLRGLRCLLTSYFGGLGDNLALACRLPVDGLHIDLVRAPEQLERVLDVLPPYKVLSLGIVDGRNIWRTDLDRALATLTAARARLGARLWIAPSCSLLHAPVDLDAETQLDAELKSWLAFATQKLAEVVVLQRAVSAGAAVVATELAAARAACRTRATSPRIHRAEVAARLHAIKPEQAERTSPYPVRAEQQRARLRLPVFPTTTIGSFPQTREIRALRREHKAGRLDTRSYHERLRAEIAEAVRRQEAYGLDVLVHGEAERNDMVEYFGELLDGFAFTEYGWVQSYGSRCVKPPILYGDVRRPAAMTVDWTRYAQSLTDKPMKGMLTGPVTILQWSFVRDDQSRADTCAQIALALRDEVLDLEAAGIAVIQIDEPALREGLPLRRGDWRSYLDWAVHCFKLSAGGVADATQIHTHMCYAEFNDIMAAIAALDADVITIETSRSDMELLAAFASFDYPNELGPGVYDIHSPNIPSVAQMVQLLDKAVERIPARRLWVNPDCGLKTRGWAEVDTALTNMVEAARQLRAQAPNAGPDRANAAVR